MPAKRPAPSRRGYRGCDSFPAAAQESARPHPRLGTLEIRILDQATSVERAAALVALVQALCAEPPEPGPELLDAVEPAARELGTWELVEGLREPVEALRQLEVGRRDGLEAVAADLVRRSTA